MSKMNIPIAIVMPVYNEFDNIRNVVQEVLRNKSEEDLFIMVDDGSCDGTQHVINEFETSGFLESHNSYVVRHSENRGYGEALLSGFRKVLENSKYEYTLTIDCDGQHQPQDIIKFKTTTEADITSASRYLDSKEIGKKAPEDRAKINRKFIETLKVEAESTLGEKWVLTDAFCGMKKYSNRFLCEFISYFDSIKHSSEYTGYGFPLTVWGFYLHWVKNNNRKMAESFTEIGIARIYTDENRSFGEKLDNPLVRYRYYMKCFNATSKIRSNFLVKC
ncbi:MAG: glycosyltransferase family 2 protein [Leptospirales bacterium]